MIEEFIEDQSGFIAHTTFSGIFFTFKTGNHISVLEFGSEKILLKGPIKVSSEEECWDIAIKFRKEKLSNIFKTLIDNQCKQSFFNGFKSGETAAKQDIKTKLGLL